MFWLRNEVSWSTNGWQLLGHRGHNRPGLQVCDFRKARGFYILFDDHGATYVGLARGTQGIGARLYHHHRNKEDWNRFCWFAFDDVEAARGEGWSQVRQRDALS